MLQLKLVNLVHFRLNLPDDNNKTVFNKGSSNALIASIPFGGQWPPNSTVGANELWKKAQKIERKKKTSLTIKRATPIVKPFCTANVWLPWYVENYNLKNFKFWLYYDRNNYKQN